MSPITDRLIAMAKAGGYLSREYVRMKISAVQEREKIAPECLQRVKNCLLRIIDHAAAKNIRIGLEARRDYEQIPTERELSELLEEMNSPHLGYWHDFGHCRSKRTWGLLIMLSGCARSVRARSAAMCKTASGLREIRPTTFYRRRRFRETCSAPSHKLLICLGDEGEYDSRCNSPVSSNVEGALRRMKKILITFFQLSVTIAVLYWVYHDPNRRAQMVEAIRNAQYRWVAMGILAYVVVEVAAAFRWHVLLKVQKIRLSLPRLSGLFFIGMFYNQFLPGGTGGDIIKSYYLLKETPDKKAGALLAVVFDRFIGLVALVAITVTLISLRYDFLAQTPETRNLLWLLLFLLGTSVLTLISTFVISGFNLFHSLPEKFPGRDKLIEISAAYHLYAHHWRATLVAFGASLVAHLATFTTFLCAAYALGARYQWSTSSP